MITITVLGLEDDFCREVLRRVAAAVAASQITAVIETHTDFAQMLARGAYVPPAILVDGALKSVGRVPEKAEVCDWLAVNPVR